MLTKHSTIAAIVLAPLLTGCEPDEIQPLDYYLAHPEELSKAQRYCAGEIQESYADYCQKISELDKQYQHIEQNYQEQYSLYQEYAAFHPGINEKAQAALAEAKRLVLLKQKGLKGEG